MGRKEPLIITPLPVVSTSSVVAADNNENPIIPVVLIVDCPEQWTHSDGDTARPIVRFRRRYPWSPPILHLLHLLAVIGIILSLHLLWQLVELTRSRRHHLLQHFLGHSMVHHLVKPHRPCSCLTPMTTPARSPKVFIFMSNSLIFWMGDCRERSGATAIAKSSLLRRRPWRYLQRTPCSSSSFFSSGHRNKRGR